MTSTASTTRNRLAGAALALLLLHATTATADDAPAAAVEQISSRVLAILADKSTSADDKVRRIQDVVYAAVDFETLSRLVVGRNWSRFNDAQRTQFAEEFKQHLSMTYGRNVESYQNEKVTIVGSRAEGNGDSTVKTKILRGGGSGDILVDYRLRQLNGQWRIIDMIIEGVSLVSNYRSQFQDIVASGGPDRLIALLREKNVKGEPLKAPKAPS